MDNYLQDNQTLPRPDTAGMPCYAGVPGTVVDECERLYTMSKAVRLEALRRIRDALAPYGQFKQWCHDHEENYGSVQYQLSQAYGTVTKQSVEEKSTAGLLGEAAGDPQAVIDAQADHIRALEARLREYEQRPAAEWAELAEDRQRRAEEQIDEWCRASAGVGRDLLNLGVEVRRMKDRWEQQDRDHPADAATAADGPGAADFWHLTAWWWAMESFELPCDWRQFTPDDPLCDVLGQFMRWALERADALDLSSDDAELQPVLNLLEARHGQRNLDLTALTWFWESGITVPPGVALRPREVGGDAA